MRPRTELTERERYILDAKPTKTYRELAAELGVTPERVRQIHAAAQRRLRWQERKAKKEK